MRSVGLRLIIVRTIAHSSVMHQTTVGIITVIFIVSVWLENPWILVVSMALLLCKGRNDMPLYSYVCTRCNLKREILCSVSGEMAPEYVDCPRCGNDKLKKVPSVPSDPQGGDTPRFFPKA